MRRYRLPDEVRYRVVADEAVILRLQPQDILGANWTGARILELLEKGESQSVVVAQLAREVDADPDELARDVSKFVARLLEHGVLEIHPDS